MTIAALVPAEAAVTPTRTTASKPESKSAFRPAPKSKSFESKKLKSALNPKPQLQLETLKTHAQFLKLSKENQELYISEIQRLILDLQKEDDALKTTYQSAQHWLSAFVGDATAAETGEDRPCVYAGWISSMDINGRSCLRPKSDGCVRGQIQCNPMLYGSGRCVAANRSATASCERSKKSILQIVSEIKGREQDWSNMREELSSYCRDPRPTQTRVCGIIRSRLARIERVLGDVPAPQFEAAASDRATPQRETARSRSTQTERTIEVEAPPPEPPTNERPVAAASSPPLSLTRSSGACEPATLLANLKPGSSSEFASSTFMDLESARTLMCTTEAIPSAWVDDQRALIQKVNGSVRGSDKYARADRQNYAAILKNFNACLRDAETLRRTGAGAVSGSFATLIETGEFIKMYDETNRPIVGLGSRYDIEGLLRAKGVSICNLRTRDNLQLAPVYSPSSGSSAGSAR